MFQYPNSVLRLGARERVMMNNRLYHPSPTYPRAVDKQTQHDHHPATNGNLNVSQQVLLFAPSRKDEEAGKHNESPTGRGFVWPWEVENPYGFGPGATSGDALVKVMSWLKNTQAWHSVPHTYLKNCIEKFCLRVLLESPDLVRTRFAIDRAALVAQLELNVPRLVRHSDDDGEEDNRANINMYVQCLLAILGRCFYIHGFLHTRKGDRDSTNANANDNEHPGDWPLRCYGPSLELDCWLYETGILQFGRAFSQTREPLIRMYGLGKLELRWLQRNQNAEERREQLLTLESYHLLKSYLGDAAVRDIREQLCFCFWQIRDVRKQRGGGGGRTYNHNHHHENNPHHNHSNHANNNDNSPRRHRNQHPPSPRNAALRQSVLARKREFKMAKIMVDRLWQDAVQNGHRTTTAHHRAFEVYGDADMPPPSSNWDKLAVGERARLLGFCSGVIGAQYATHPAFFDIADLWLRPLMARTAYDAVLAFAERFEASAPSPEESIAFGSIFGS